MSSPEHVMIAGQMARDVALAERLARTAIVSVASPDHHPQLINIAEKSGGGYYEIPDICDGESIASEARNARATLFITNSDDALAADVAGIVRRQCPYTLVASPDKQSSRGEWDKNFLRQIVAEIDYEDDTHFNPMFSHVPNEKMLSKEFNVFETRGIKLAIKPQNLAGGKGVRVMDIDFDTYKQGKGYAGKVLLDPNQSGLLLEEKILGHEFTLQCITDGKVSVSPPVTFDYPWRYDGDKSPGTGGTGTFTMADGLMPFVSQSDYDEAMRLQQRILGKFAELGLNFKGVLYLSFFKTKDGLKLTEINARGGDPELVNIIDLLEDDVDLAKVYRQVALGELDTEAVRFKQLASTMIYLMHPQYARRKRSTGAHFTVRQEVFEEYGLLLRMSSARRLKGDSYITKPGRAVGISGIGKTPWEIRARIHKAIKEGIDGSLDFRLDVGDKAYINRLAEIPG